MKANPILEAIRESYVRHGQDTENAIFSMIMTKAVRDKFTLDIENFNIGLLVKTIHETSQGNSCINFREGELNLGKYEIHSVSASRDDEGEPEVFVHMLNGETMETQSRRIQEFRNIDWVLRLAEAVHEKCDMSLEIGGEDEE